MLKYIGITWGLIGVTSLLGFSIIRLSLITLESFSYPFFWYHWLILILNTIQMAYSEGYKGFQKGFSPRIAARLKYMKDHPKFLDLLLAPLFCMGFFRATKKRMIISYCVLLFVITLIYLISFLEQPWRGIIDMGVVVGLSWGLCTTLLFSFKALLNQSFNHPHEVAPFSLCLYKYKKNEHTSVNNSIKSRANVTKF